MASVGADDRNDCGPDGHDFEVEQLLVDGFALRMVHACTRCGAFAYEPSRSDEDAHGFGGLAGT